MNTNRNFFWGLTCVTLGVLFLARNWNLFPMPDWHFVRTLWPVLFILGGAALILRTTTPVMSVVATGLLAVALPFWLFSYIGRHHNYREDRDLSMRFDPPSPPSPPSPPGVPNPPSMDMDDDNDDDEDDDDDDFDTNRHLKAGTFMEDMPVPAPTEARFRLEGGAAKFRMDDTTPKLIDARTKAVNLYSMSIDRVGTQIPTVRLSPAKGSSNNINLFDDDGDSDFGEVVVKLNESPLWDMQMDFGAGAADFDLSRYAVKALKVEAGAASLDLRLGDRAAQSDVRISSGMASVKIKVPKTAGVKITTDGGLNSTDIDDDFDKVGSSTYLSPNYNTSTKKITIRYDGGLSSLKVSRY